MLQAPDFELFDREDVQVFMKKHRNEDPAVLALRYSGKTNFPIQAVTAQIKLRKKAKEKLPEWVDAGCLFTSLTLEQASSTFTAKWKADKIQTLFKPQTLLDCNTGLGVDAFYFSKNIPTVFTIEKDPEKYNLFVYNKLRLHADAIQTLKGDVLEWLKTNPDTHFDMVYADPGRRTESGQRNADPLLLEPALDVLLPLLKEKSPYILLKMSPMFDPAEGIKIFPHVREVWIVSIKHECREILFLMESGYTGSVTFRAAAWFNKKWYEGDGIPGNENEADETNAFAYISDVAFVLSSLCPIEMEGITGIWDQGRLIMSSKALPDYPGIAYQFIERMPYQVKHLLKKLPLHMDENRLHMSAKGTGLVVEEEYKKLKVRPGGNYLLYVRKGEPGMECFLLKKT